MKISEQWLREWVDPPLTTDELAEQLTMAGFEVDGLEPCSPGFEKVIAARIIKVEPHPEADGQRVCEVDTGTTTATVVTGAGNAESGRCFALALPGARLPGGREIGDVAIRGVASMGMLCSAQELGLSTESDRLFELDSSVEAGMAVAEHLRLDDHVLDLSLTPNRGDCFSMAGIAREVGVLNNLPLSRPVFDSVTPAGDFRRTVTLQEVSACPRYAGRIIRGIDISTRAPDWVLERLRRADIRSINVIVDLTNYVMLELGQPMHAFDNDRLAGDIVVRMPQRKERLVLLDGQDCEVQADTLLIADDSGPVALAGIIGGLETAVSDATRDIFLESAYFSPQAVAGRARRYGLHTDASMRYERGVDFTLQEQALERLSALIVSYCGGEAGPLVVCEQADALPQRPRVSLESGSITRLLGVEIETEQVRRILTALGLEVADKETGFEVRVPAFRFDISIEADLIEEVARIYGYDNMPSAPPLAGLRMNTGNSDDGLRELQQCLLNRGYYEVITYSFLDRNEQEALLGPVQALPLLNPISSDLGVMRCSLIPGLLGALAYNHKRQQERIRLFEWGRIFKSGKRIEQALMLGGMISGNNYLKQWDKQDTLSDIYDLKGDLEALLRLTGQDKALRFEAIQHPALHPGQAAKILLYDQELGVLGAIHPGLLKDYDLEKPALVFEIALSQIVKKVVPKFTKFSKYPKVRRDLSILVEQDIEVARVMECVEKAASPLLSNLELFDLYQGEGIDPQKKSLALGLTFQASSSTLTEEEVEGVMTRVIDTLNLEIGATLRD